MTWSDRGIQARAIPEVWAGRDLCVPCKKQVHGKALPAYLLAALHRVIKKNALSKTWSTCGGLGTLLVSFAKQVYAVSCAFCWRSKSFLLRFLIPRAAKLTSQHKRCKKRSPRFMSRHRAFEVDHLKQRHAFHWWTLEVTILEWRRFACWL